MVLADCITKHNYLCTCIAAHANACLFISCNGRPGSDIRRTVPPGYHLVSHNPPGQLYHLGSCGLRHVYPIHRIDSSFDAPHAQQAPFKRCHQEDEPAGLGEATLSAGDPDMG